MSPYRAESTKWLERVWTKAVVAADVRSFFEGLFAEFLDPGHSGSSAVLITGAPGTGKSHFLAALANECGLPLVHAPQPFFMMRRHEGAGCVREWFEGLRGHPLGLAIVEEIEWTTRRSVDDDGMPELADAFIDEWDSQWHRTDGRVLLLATSLVPTDIDPRMKQRLERSIDFPAADEPMRRRLLHALLLQIGASTDVPSFVEQELVRPNDRWRQPLTHNDIRSIVLVAQRRQYNRDAPSTSDGAWRIDEAAWREALDEKYESDRRRASH